MFRLTTLPKTTKEEESRTVSNSFLLIQTTMEAIMLKTLNKRYEEAFQLG
jgi:hypothetical protein